MTSLVNVDANYNIVRSASSATTTVSYNPSAYTLLGSTSLVSGAVFDLVSKNSAYLTFRSYASSTDNLIVNNGFESAGTWVPASSNGGSATVQDSAEKRSGTYSGKTSTTDPTNPSSHAQLSQSLTATSVSSIPDTASSLNLWLRNGGKASDDYYYIEVQVTSSQGRTLHYRWNLGGGASSPSDTTTDKYVTIGTSLPLGSWTQFERNLYSDWVVTKGMPSSDTIDGIVLYSAGRRDPPAPYRYYAQLINWEDVTLTRGTEYTCEVEFTGSSNSYSWTQLVWTVDSAWTAASVTVTIQLYDFNGASYPSSGDGYISYTSSATPNTDETETQTITTNPQNFRDASGNWKIKIKGVEATSTQFDFKVNWIEYAPTYHSEYTVSTEFLFSGIAGTPTLLVFRIVSQYDLGFVSVTVQVWSYNTGSYATSGEGYSTYVSSATASTDETETLTIMIDPGHYISSGNAKIKITAIKATPTQFQQKVNQIKLDTFLPVTLTTTAVREVTTHATITQWTTLSIVGIEHTTHTVRLIDTTTASTTLTSLTSTTETVTASTTTSTTSTTTTTQTATSTATTTTTYTPALWRRCVIASAAYGSELSSEVQFLRGFRDNLVESTFAGSQFMKTFNAFYYSFSPAAANIVAETQLLSQTVRVLMYPLMVVLRMASTVFEQLSSVPEFAVVVSGLTASLLIGAIYLSPIMFSSLLLKRTRRFG